MVCQLCGTRMHVHESQIGKMLRCPDCHSETEVKAPKVLPPSPRKPTLDELEEFQLSDPGERPAYRPMVEAKGEYAELQLLDPMAPPRKTEASATIDSHPPLADDLALSVETATIPASQAVSHLERPHSAVARVEDDLEDQEVVLTAPVERIEIKPEVPKLPPPQGEERRDKVWNDADWGFIANPREAGAWKKSPFYIGILGVLAQPQTLLRAAIYSVGLTLIMIVVGNAIIYASLGGGERVMAVFCMFVSAAAAALWVACFSPCLLAIATDTGNGEDQVQSWPDWSITEWIFQALYIPVAGALAALPGIILASMFMAVGEGAQWFAPFPPIVSLLGIFPIVFSSMLVEGSIISPVSGKVLKTIQSHGDGWIVICVLSFFFFILVSLAVVLLEVGIQMEGAGLVLMSIPAAVLMVTLMILYFRLLGRLMWYTQNVRKKAGEE